MVRLEVHLINEGKLVPGDYALKIEVKDGDGKETGFPETFSYLVPVSENVPGKN